MLFKVKDLLVVLVCLLRILVLGTLEVFIEFLNLDVKVLLFISKSVELPLSLKPGPDVLLELGVGELPHFRVEQLKEVDELVLVLLDLPLVALHIGVVLQLSA